jgi:hypothetical protein
MLLRRASRAISTMGAKVHSWKQQILRQTKVILAGLLDLGTTPIENWPTRVYKCNGGLIAN